MFRTPLELNLEPHEPQFDRISLLPPVGYATVYSAIVFHSIFHFIREVVEWGRSCIITESRLIVEGGKVKISRG